MKLIQELLTTPLQDDEVVMEEISSRMDVHRFKHSFDTIESSLEALGKFLKEDSFFFKNAEKLGGDTGNLKDAIESYKKLYSAMEDLHMSVGLANEENWD